MVSSFGIFEVMYMWVMSGIVRDVLYPCSGLNCDTIYAYNSVQPLILVSY